jgi:hypothetical protein
MCSQCLLSMVCYLGLEQQYLQMLVSCVIYMYVNLLQAMQYDFKKIKRKLIIYNNIQAMQP